MAGIRCDLETGAIVFVCETETFPPVLQVQSNGWIGVGVFERMGEGVGYEFIQQHPDVHRLISDHLKFFQRCFQVDRPIGGGFDPVLHHLADIGRKLNRFVPFISQQGVQFRDPLDLACQFLLVGDEFLFGEGTGRVKLD